MGYLFKITANGVSHMQLIYHTDTYNYGDKQSTQYMVDIISSPFSQSHIRLIHIDCVSYAVHKHSMIWIFDYNYLIFHSYELTYKSAFT